MYMDLKQEATLVAYSMLSEGVTDTNKIATAMRDRASNFYNFGQLPVHVPASGGNRRARAAYFGGDSSQTIEWPLLSALMASKGCDALEEGKLHGDADHTTDFENQEYLQHIKFTMETCLDNREYFAVVSVFLHEVDRGEVADELGISKQRLGQVIDTAIGKLRLGLSL
jgi:hypothetical protein